MKKKPRKSASRRHAEVETLSLFGTTARLGPYGLIQFAGQFLSAAKSIQIPLVRTYLVCHALELALKAFLALKGRNLVELRIEYGHNLKKLIADAETMELHTLVKLNDCQRAEIIRASDYYVEKVLEYASLLEAIRGYPKMASTDVLIGAADALVGALHEPCLHAE